MVHYAMSNIVELLIMESGLNDCIAKEQSVKFFMFVLLFCIFSCENNRWLLVDMPHLFGKMGKTTGTLQVECKMNMN